MPTLREITLRHARHYEAELRKTESLYVKSSKTLPEALAKFDDIWANVLAAQVWAETQAEDDQEAALLNVAYQNAAPHLFDLRQHPQERVRRLKRILFAVRRFNLRDSEVSIMNNL